MYSDEITQYSGLNNNYDNGNILNKSIDQYHKSASQPLELIFRPPPPPNKTKKSSVLYGNNHN